MTNPPRRSGSWRIAAAEGPRTRKPPRGVVFAPTPPAPVCPHEHISTWTACLAEGGTAEGDQCDDCGAEWRR